MIVSVLTPVDYGNEWRNPLRTTAHEIAHLFGTYDGRCVVGQPCAMNTPAFPLEHSRWCDNCWHIIYSNRELHS